MASPSPFSLHDAIGWVDTQAQDPDPLVRLRTASGLAQGLADIGDAILGYFVDQARHGGHSWSEVGDALGVSKQAAQQRHTLRVSLGPNAPTVEHLTPRARRVASEAEEVARSWGHGYVGTEHLLLALYREPEGVGAQVLVSLGLSKKNAESTVAERIRRGEGRMEGDLTFTPRALAVFSSALSSALAMGHNYIGTEHLLLGLAQGDGVAAAVLRDGGLTEEMVAREIESTLARYVQARSPARPAKPAKPTNPAKAPRKRTAAKAPAPKKATPARKARRR